MSDGEDATVAAEVPTVAAPGEPMDLNTALQVVMKKALAHDGLARGLSETTKAIERGQCQLCVLAENCDQADYKKLIEALCKEKNVSMITVPDSKQLGEWAGLCRIDADGSARKVVGCSSVVIKDYGEESEGLNVLSSHLKSRA